MPKLRIYYEITSACNLQCPYCFEQNYSIDHLKFEELKNFHSIVSDAVSDVVVTGGEPFLHPEIYQIIEYLSAVSPVTITTNGTLVNPERITKMMSRFPDLNLQISMDSTISEIMRRIRGENTLDIINNLIEKCKDVSSQTGISVTVIKDNIDCIPELIKFAEDHNISVYFPELIPFGGLSKNWDKLMPPVEEYVNFEDKLIGLIANDNKMTVTSNKVEKILSRYFTEKDNKIRTIKVDTKGNIIICPAADSGCSDAVITDIRHIADLNGLLEEIDNKPVCISANLLSSCNNCEFKHVCNGIFCGNCKYMKNDNESILKYICKTYYHHFKNISDIGDNYE